MRSSNSCWLRARRCGARCLQMIAHGLLADAKPSRDRRHAGGAAAAAARLPARAAAGLLDRQRARRSSWPVERFKPRQLLRDPVQSPLRGAAPARPLGGPRCLGGLPKCCSMCQTERRLELLAVNRFAQHAVRAGGRDFLQRSRSRRGRARRYRRVPCRSVSSPAKVALASVSRSGSVRTSNCGGRWRGPGRHPRQSSARWNASKPTRSSVSLKWLAERGVAVDDERAAGGRGGGGGGARGLAAVAEASVGTTRPGGSVQGSCSWLRPTPGRAPGEGLHRQQHSECRAGAGGADHVDAASGLRHGAVVPSAVRCPYPDPGPWW